MQPKVFSDIPQEDLTKLENLLDTTFDDVYKTCDTLTLPSISYRVYTSYKEVIDETISNDKKFFKTKFLDIINADDYEFQKFVNRYVKGKVCDPY